MGLYVGKSGKRDVEIDISSLNSHIMLTGLSGSGKSVRMLDIINHASQQGRTILVFDKDGTGYDIPKSNRISAINDGLNLNFLGRIDTSSEEKRRLNLMNATDLLSAGVHFGGRQRACLRKVIEEAAKNRQKFPDDMQAISYFLQSERSSVADSVFDALWGVLEGNIFRQGNGCFLKSGNVNVISFAGMNPKLQVQVIEIMLSAIWHRFRERGCCGKECLLCIDEMQSLSLKKETVLFELLTEARKYGLSLLLATQTLDIFNSTEQAVLGQAAVKVFFRPQENDVRKVAKMVDLSNVERTEMILRNLKKGQALTVGNLNVNGHQILSPIITKSDWGCIERECQELSNL